MVPVQFSGISAPWITLWYLDYLGRRLKSMTRTNFRYNSHLDIGQSHVAISHKPNKPPILHILTNS